MIVFTERTAGTARRAGCTAQELDRQLGLNEVTLRTKLLRAEA